MAIAVVIGGKVWQVVVASTPTEIATGLSNVAQLPASTGVLFDMGYGRSSIQIDMSRMLFALDLVFISSACGVVGVLRDVQPGEEAGFMNGVGARWFLEVNAGEAEGVNVGDNVDIQGYAVDTYSPIVAMLVTVMMMTMLLGVVE